MLRCRDEDSGLVSLESGGEVRGDRLCELGCVAVDLDAVRPGARAFRKSPQDCRIGQV